MSGGSMNYLYSKLDYDANFQTNTPERRAFKKHLVKVSKALHDIEWVDSCDYGPGDENAAIRACLSPEQLDEARVLRSLLVASLGALLYHTEQTRPIQRTKETIQAIEHALAGFLQEPSSAHTE